MIITWVEIGYWLYYDQYTSGADDQGLLLPSKPALVARYTVIRYLSRTIVIVGMIATPAVAETVDVKYRGPVDLKPFTCTDTPRSSFIRRVCYDKRNSYMLISLNGTYYHYCGIDDGTVSALLIGESAGRYFNANVKGHFDCRTGRVRAY